MIKFLNRYFKWFVDGYFLYRLDIDHLESESSVGLLEGYSTRELERDTAGDIEQLYRIWGEAYYDDPQTNAAKVKADVEPLLAGDDICTFLLYGDEVAGMQWSGFRRAFQSMDFAECLLRDCEAAIFHHSYISPKYRGKKQQIPMMWYAQSLLRQRGVRRLYTFVGVENFASVKNMMKSYDFYQVVYHIKIVLPLREFNLFPGFSLEKWTRSK